VLVAACVFATALRGAPASAMRADNWTVIGHRGFPRAGHTEDTIPSFAAAEEAGATAVELDLHLTADHRMVVMHDSTLDRTTTCHGSVGTRTLHSILARCRGKVAGERIPTVEQVLSWAKTNSMNVILELKTSRADRWTVPRLEVLDRMVREHGMLQQVILMSYGARFLGNAEQADPALETDWIARQWPGVEVAARTADSVNVYASELTVQRVEQLHAVGLRVFGRMTDKSTAWQRLDEVGVDGVLTDRTMGYVAWRETH
jgi:glycerophosphoryl diester phosphodiesterase